MVDEHPLAHCPFAYQERKGDVVTISFEGRTVTTLRGRQAVQFCTRVAGRDALEQQLVMAKATGQFKMGNEKNHVPKY